MPRHHPHRLFGRPKPTLTLTTLRTRLSLRLLLLPDELLS